MSFTRLNLMGATLAVATMLSATTAFGQTPPPPAEPPQQEQQKEQPQPEMAAATVIEGELLSVDATTKSIVVKTADGTDETVRYDDSTKVTGGQSGVAGLANSKGTDVTVTLRGEGAERVAAEIAIREKS